MSNPVINIYGDGSADYTIKWGGYGTIMRLGDYEQEFSGAVYNTTSQRMELTAALFGLRKVRWKHAKIYVKSDSGYLISTFNKKWYIEWEQRGWFKKDGKPVKNLDLIKELIKFHNDYNVSWQYLSEEKSMYIARCHTLAYNAMRHAAIESKKRQWKTAKS